MTLGFSAVNSGTSVSVSMSDILSEHLVGYKTVVSSWIQGAYMSTKTIKAGMVKVLSDVWWLFFPLLF